MIDHEYLVILLVFSALFILAFFVDRFVKTAKTFLNKDTGIFWFANLLTFFSIFFFYSFLYFITTFSELDLTKNHLPIINKILPVFLNQQEIDNTIKKYSLIWINVIVIFWLISLLVTLLLPSKVFKSLQQSTWCEAIVGTLTSRIRSRKWVLYVFLLPILLALLLPLPYVWGHFSFYPIFIFNAGFVFIVVISMIALSQPPKEQNNDNEQQSNQEEKADSSKDLWPDKLKEGGVDLEYLGVIPAVKNQKEKVKSSNFDFTLRANTFLKYGGAEELLEGVKDLLTPGGDIRKRHKQIRAQDDCGQFESAAIAAEALFLRYYTITLWIAPEQQIVGIKRQLHHFFHEGDNRNLAREDDGRVYVLNANTPNPEKDTSMILLTDAKTLSDSFMNTLVANELILQRIGMVVWWDLHEYTGVLAGNMWAIIHRLHRLIELKGRSDIRVMAFLRQAHNQEANVGGFAQDLLPFEFLSESIIDIPVEQSQLVYLYKLKGIDPFAIDPTPIKAHQHTLLYAVRASIIAGWNTYIKSPSVCLTDEEIFSFFDRKESIYGEDEQHKLSMHIPSSSASAQALILQLDSRNALAMAELLASLGREGDNKSYYVGILSNGNSYIDFILKQFCNNAGKMLASQSLMVPKPSKEIISRHMKKALYETANTQSDIRTDFQFKNEIIEEILEEIKKDGHLRTSEVRYLVDGSLKIEPEYRSIGGRYDHSSDPLDTNSSDLIKVIAAAIGAEKEGVRLEIDSHRVTILAYPGRVFHHKGRRFEIPLNDIGEWEKWQRTGEIHCKVTDKKVRTFRLRVPSFYNCRRTSANIATEKNRHFLMELSYEESIEGVVSKSTAYSGTPSTTEIKKFKDIFSKRFETKARCIEIPNASFDAITAIAEALYYALPVHLGVNEDVLEITAVKDLDIDREDSFTGIAIIELYSAGVGLVEMLDMHTFPVIFKGIQKWLENCPCSDGCEACIHGEEMRFSFKRTISKQEALKTLSNLV